MTDNAPTLPPSWRQFLKDVALIAFVVGLAFSIAVQAGWIMTREAHAQDIGEIRMERDQLLLAIRQDATATRRYAWQARQYAACVYFSVPWEQCPAFDPPELP